MNTRRFVLLLGLALLLPVSYPGAAPDKDYSAELPRIPPKEPAEALKTFKLHPGFRIELVASEPLIRSPVALDFDENGRMFVVQYPEYHQYANKAFKGPGRLRVPADPD